MRVTRRQLRRLIREVYIGREGKPPVDPRRYVKEKMRPEMEKLGLWELLSDDPVTAKELYVSLADDPIASQIVDLEASDPFLWASKRRPELTDEFQDKINKKIEKITDELGTIQVDMRYILSEDDLHPEHPDWEEFVDLESRRGTLLRLYDKLKNIGFKQARR